MRPIDADILEDNGYELHRTYRKDASTMVYEVKQISEIPTIEVEPVSRGWWKRYDIDGTLLSCSRCKRFFFAARCKGEILPMVRSEDGE